MLSMLRAHKDGSANKVGFATTSHVTSEYYSIRLSDATAPELLSFDGVDDASHAITLSRLNLFYGHKFISLAAFLSSPRNTPRFRECFFTPDATDTLNAIL